MAVPIEQDLKQHPFQECPNCHRMIHQNVIEHFCQDANAPRLVNEPASTAESDYATLDPPKKDKEETDEQTVCSYCGGRTFWENKPQGFQWICSNLECGRINVRIDTHTYYPPSLEDLAKNPSTPRNNLENAYMNPMIQAFAGQADEVNKNGYPFKGKGEPTYYLSGPISDEDPQQVIWNINEFMKYARKYRDEGRTILNPVEIVPLNDELSYSDYIRADLVRFLESNIIGMYMLPGWRTSKGACLEKHLADVLNIPVYDANTGSLETITDEAYDTVYGSRRKAYGSALDNFDHTAKMWSAGIAQKLHTSLTAEDVALMMVLFKLSRLFISPGHHDSMVDVIGYDLCYQDIIEERKYVGTSQDCNCLSKN